MTGVMTGDIAGGCYRFKEYAFVCQIRFSVKISKEDVSGFRCILSILIGLVYLTSTGEFCESHFHLCQSCRDSLNLSTPPTGKSQ